eukprot:3705066-Alexandrium_andersonii.AAC.1
MSHQALGLDTPRAAKPCITDDEATTWGGSGATSPLALATLGSKCSRVMPVSYTHLRAHETSAHL